MSALKLLIRTEEVAESRTVSITGGSKGERCRHNGLGVEVSNFVDAAKEGLFRGLIGRVVSRKEDGGADMQRQGCARASCEALKLFTDKDERKGRQHDGCEDFGNKTHRVPDGKGGLAWEKNEGVGSWRTWLLTVALMR